MKANAHETPLWLEVAHACRLFGVRRSAFYATYRPLLSESDLRKVGGVAEVNATALVRAAVKLERERAAAELGIELGEVREGEKSPGLERYRIARAQIAEHEAARLKGEMVVVGDVHQGLRLFDAAIRRGVEALQLKFGNDAAELVLIPLTQLEEELDKGSIYPPEARAARKWEDDERDDEPGRRESGRGGDPTPGADGDSMDAQGGAGGSGAGGKPGGIVSRGVDVGDVDRDGGGGGGGAVRKRGRGGAAGDRGPTLRNTPASKSELKGKPKAPSPTPPRPKS